MNKFGKKLKNIFNVSSKTKLKNEVRNNFCGFFQAVTRSINAVLGKDLTEKDLKKSCCEFAKNNKWVEEIIIEEFKQNPSSSTNSNDILENYLSNLEANENVKPEIEGRIICNIYNIQIHILRNQNQNWTKENTIEILPDVGSLHGNKVIHLISNGDGAYSNCFDQEHCCPRAMLEERLEEFVIKFVQEFETKLALHKLILEGEVNKAGKFSDTYADWIGQAAGGAIFGLVGFFLGISGIASEIGKTVGESVSKKVLHKFGSDLHRKKVLNLSETVNFFHKFPKDFRKILVKVALDNFQSFEMQFGRVSSDLNENGTMHLLAIDAMNRAINYISVCPSAKIDFHSFILNGVKFGKSKTKVITNISIAGKNDGFKIKYEYGSVNLKWKTGDLYENVGLVVFENEEIKFFIKEAFKKYSEYGFRRCFTYENYKELLGYKNIENNELMKMFTSYSYVFQQEEIMLKVDNLCNKIQEKENNALDESRLNEIISEFKSEILDELKNFKTIINKSKKVNNFEHDFEILEIIRSNIKDLKVKDYKEKLLSQIFQNVQDIKKDIHEVNENVSLIAENSKTLLNKVDNLADKIDVLHSQNSSKDHPIWFNLRQKPLTLFIGRDEILEQITKDLENNIVVICGLGGMGKSELAIKYAHTYFNLDQNVVWINSESTESFIDSCSRLSQLVKVDTKDSKGNEKYLDIILTEIFQKLSNRKSLFILDNAEKYSVIEPFLTKISNGNKAIITSRQNADWENEWESFKIIRVNIFTDSEAISFVKQFLPDENNDYSDQDINELINVLGNYPLALTHALTYIKKTSTLLKKMNKSFTIRDYLLKFESDPVNLMETKTTGKSHQNSIFKVLKLTLENLDKEILEKDAFLVLKNISFLVPNNISEMFYSISIENSDDLPYVIDLLDSYSLVNVINGNLSVHRLVQDTIRREMEESEKVLILGNILRVLVTQLIDWKTTIACLPQVISVWNFACKYDELIEKFIINDSADVRMCIPFLDLMANCGKIDLFKEIIDRIKNKNLYQLMKLIDTRDFYGSSLPNLMDHNDEIVAFFKDLGANSFFKNF